MDKIYEEVIDEWVKVRIREIENSVTRKLLSFPPGAPPEDSQQEPEWVRKLKAVLDKQVFANMGQDAYWQKEMASVTSAYSAGVLTGGMLTMIKQVREGRLKPTNTYAQQAASELSCPEMLVRIQATMLYACRRFALPDTAAFFTGFARALNNPAIADGGKCRSANVAWAVYAWLYFHKEDIKARQWKTFPELHAAMCKEMPSAWVGTDMNRIQQLAHRLHLSIENPNR